MVEQLAAHRLAPFQKRFHKATDFRAWVRSDKIYNISFQPLFEPYLIMRRAYVPWADESLRGYYFNKQLLMRHVAALGAHLVVHPAAFVLHQPHKSSAMRWKTRHLGVRQRNQAIYEDAARAMRSGSYLPAVARHERCYVGGAGADEEDEEGWSADLQN